MKTKIGEVTGKTLYSTCGSIWFSTPEAAQRAGDKRDDSIQRSKTTKD